MCRHMQMRDIGNVLYSQLLWCPSYQFLTLYLCSNYQNALPDLLFNKILLFVVIISMTS